MQSQHTFKNKWEDKVTLKVDKNKSSQDPKTGNNLTTMMFSIQ